MSKSFRDYFIEKFNPALFEPVADAKGEKRFIAKHKVQKHADPEGNGPDVFQASKVKTFDRSAHRMGNDAQQALDAYEDWDHGFTEEELELICDSMTEEEFEQLDELSKKTLANYIDRAAYSAGDRAYEAGAEGIRRYTEPQHSQEHDERAGRAINKSFSRLRGVTRAANKMAGQKVKVPANEETQLDELSRKTLAAYAKKSASDMKFSYKDSAEPMYTNAGPGGTGPRVRARSQTPQQLFSRSEKRRIGLNKALSRLAKEETQLDELSRKILRSYVNKSVEASFRDGARSQDKDSDSFRKYGKRWVGVNKATAKLSNHPGLKVHSSEVEREKKNDKLRRLAYGSKRYNNEETDLVELSKHTLVSYINKSGVSSAHQGQNFERGHRQGDPEKVRKAQKNLNNRVHGMTKAAGRLAYGGGHALSQRSSSSGITVREGQELTELGQETLRSYIKKAGQSAAIADDSEAHYRDLSSRFTNPHYKEKAHDAGERSAKKSEKRFNGIRKAVGKFNKMVGEGKTFKDSRKYFDDDSRSAMRKKFQDRMQARKEGDS